MLENIDDALKEDKSILNRRLLILKLFQFGGQDVGDFRCMATFVCNLGQLLKNMLITDQIRVSEQVIDHAFRAVTDLVAF